jgi:integrase
VEAFLLEQWLPAVEGRLRPSTRANYQTNLQIHIIPALDALKLQRLTAPRIAAFLTHVRDDRLYALWILVATTDMRRAELAGLRWSDIDFTRARLTPRLPL